VLFLLTFHEFLEKKEKTGWAWIVAAGIAIGVGVQLHTILLVLLPATTFFLFLFFMAKSPRTWSRWILIILLVLILNLPQIVEGSRNNFANVRRFFSMSNDTSNPGKIHFYNTFQSYALCGAQANAYAVAPLTNERGCDFQSTIRKFVKQKYRVPLAGNGNLYLTAVYIIFSILLLFWGTAVLIYLLVKENDPSKKRFLGLVALYFFLSILVMFPVVYRGEIRYFQCIIFTPFLFLGFLFDLLIRGKSMIYRSLAVLFFLFLAATNIFLIQTEAGRLLAKNDSNSENVILGEANTMVSYLIPDHSGQKTVYLAADGKYLQTYVAPLSYLLNERGYALQTVRSLDKNPRGVPLYYIADISQKLSSSGMAKKRKIIYFKDFGQVTIYRLEN
jgi:hypothetical protein